MEDVQSFKLYFSEKADNWRTQKAEWLFEHYCKENSVMEVNISAKSRTAITKAFEYKLPQPVVLSTRAGRRVSIADMMFKTTGKPEGSKRTSIGYYFNRSSQREGSNLTGFKSSGQNLVPLREGSNLSHVSEGRIKSLFKSGSNRSMASEAGAKPLPVEVVAAPVEVPKPAVQSNVFDRAEAEITKEVLHGMWISFQTKKAEAEAAAKQKKGKKRG